MAETSVDADAEVLRVLGTLPIACTPLEWVQLMVGAWNEANATVRARTECDLTVSDQHEIANALLLADKRSCCRERRMGGRNSRVVMIQEKLKLAIEALWKLDIPGFYQQCEWIEAYYPKSTVYEALRGLMLTVE